MEFLNNLLLREKDIILSIGYVFIIIISTILIVKILKRIIYRNKDNKNGTLKPLKFYSSLIFGIVYFFGALLCIYIIPPLRSISVSIFASSGILAIVIGFAAQHALSNIVSGCFIAFFKPFCIGDKVKFIGKDVVGIVEDITMRHTIIRTFENKRVIIPNSVVSVDVIENAHMLEEKVCSFFEIGISYDSNHKKAMDIIREEVKNHVNFFDNRTKEEKAQGMDSVKVKIMGFGDFTVNIRAWVWAKDNATGFDMVCDLNQSVKERFDKEGIEIPFPYRTIVHKDKEIKPISNK